MKKIALLFAQGTEEIEALTPYDVLKRAGADCKIFAVQDELLVEGSHGIVVKADKLLSDLDMAEYDGIIVPGGMLGSKNITESQKAIEEISKALAQGKMVASICASPAVVLARHNFIDGKKATCYPAEQFIAEIKKTSTYTASAVEVDGNVITANGIKSAFDFALAICEYLKITPKF